MRYVTIDPGLHKVAYAIWNERGTLLGAGLVNHSHDPGIPRAQKWRDVAEWTDVACTLDSGEQVVLVIEIPQIYNTHEAKKKDPNDLIDLAGVVGAIASKICVGYVDWSPLPREWKGQLPKEISVKRVEEKLSAKEKILIKWPAKSLRHNVYDALHLGLTYLAKKGLR